MIDKDPIMFHFSELHLRAALLMAATHAALIVADGNFKDEKEARKMIEEAIESIIDIEKNRAK